MAHIQKDINGANETDVREILRFIDARTFHNFVLGDMDTDEQKQEMNYLIDEKGREYDTIGGAMAANIEKAYGFRQRGYCVASCRFSNAICGKLGIKAEAFYCPAHVFNVVNIAKKKYVLDFSYGQFFTSIGSTTLFRTPAEKAINQELCDNGFMEYNEMRKETHEREITQGETEPIIECKWNLVCNLHNDRTPRDILELRSC